MMPHLPNFLRFSNNYFWYFAIIGLMSPYLSVFLDGRGLSSREIGEIVGAVTATRIVGPTLWAMLSDKTGMQTPIIRLGTVLSLVSFCALFFFEGYWAMLIALCFFSLFWTAILPQIEVLTLRSIRKSPKIYARIRLWGSIGFIVTALVSSELIARHGTDTYLLIGVTVSIGLVLSSLLLINKKNRVEKTQFDGSILHKIFQLPFIIFFVSGLLLQLSFGSYYGFFALYLDDYGYKGYIVGVLVAVAPFAEIGIFIIAGQIFKRFKVKVLIVFSMFAAALRWWLTASYTDVIWILVLSQSLHAICFGVYHSASMQFIHRHFSPSQQNRGQAIYIGGVFGVGGAIGAYIAGIIWDNGAGGQSAYYFSASVAFVAMLIAFLLPTNIQSNKHA